MRLTTREKCVLAVGLALSILVLPVGVSPVAAHPRVGLPLGSPGLTETRDTVDITQGVTLTTITRGVAGTAEFWTLPAKIPPSGSVLGDLANATALHQALSTRGLPSRVEMVTSPRFADVPAAILGYRVRIGSYPSFSEARTAAWTLGQLGVQVAAPQHTAEDGGQTTGPWAIRVLTIDPRRFPGTLAAAHGPSLAAPAATSQIAAESSATAAINGGFYVTSGSDGFPGDPAGIHVERGRVISEATNGRVALRLIGDGTRLAIARLSTMVTVTDASGKKHPVDGVNRAPGKIRNCGGDASDQPTALPLHDVTCTDDSELIVFTPEFGAGTPAGEGAAATVDSTGTVTGVGDRRGGTVPQQGWIMQGIGAEATWLADHVRVGDRISFEAVVRDDSGRRIILGPRDSVINGGPQLMNSGTIDIRPRADGLVHDDPAFLWNWGVRRNPRTMVGATASGKILLVAADGRQSASNVGLTLWEAARVMKSLGAVVAMNLDGGGSTTMVAGGRVVNTPSDPSGERAVGNALVVKPR